VNETFALVTGLHWGGVIFYVAATILAVSGFVFKKERLEGWAKLCTLPGLCLHGAGILVWWRFVGHGPYMDRFEVLSSNAWIMLAVLLVFSRFYPRLQAAQVVVFPASFIMVALGLFLKPEIKNLKPIFRGVWLALHILFYKIAFASVLIAFAFSVFYLMKSAGRLQRFSRLPAPDIMDLYAYRFAGFGFTFWAIGMLAGSIWAYQSWNMFWSWEPVQVWALVTWGLFGLYLHLRRFFGWSGKKASWLFTFCFLMSCFSIFVTPFIKSSIHSVYFR
jgi:ABC-type transport system involved in cytochrome c biogenesis permease subunit